MDFKQFLLVLRRRWRSVALVFLFAVGVAAGISYAITPKYESTAKVFLSVNTKSATDASAVTYFLTTGRSPTPTSPRARSWPGGSSRCSTST